MIPSPHWFITCRSAHVRREAGAILAACAALLSGCAHAPHQGQSAHRVLQEILPAVAQRTMQAQPTSAPRPPGDPGPGANPGTPPPLVPAPVVNTGGRAEPPGNPPGILTSIPAMSPPASAGGGGGSSPPPLLEFPLHPPKPTTWYGESLGELSPQSTWESLRQVAKDIAAVLNARDRRMLHGFYRYGERGFAVVTNLENFRKDGSPVPPEKRWTQEIPPPRLFEWLSRLVTAPVGTYRLFAIIVSPGEPVFDTREESALTAAAAVKLGRSGGTLGSLPRELLQTKVTDEYFLTVAIYEFQRTDLEDKATFNFAPILSAEQHATAIGLLPFRRQ